MSRVWQTGERFSVNYYPDLGRRFPRFKNSWNGEVSTFRVTGFYKIYVKPERVPSNNPEAQAMCEILDKILADEYDERTDREKLLDRFKVVLEMCTFEDAEFIHGQSVSYPTVPIEWCNYLGDVAWSPEVLEKNRDEYADRLKRQKKRSDISRHRTTHPRYDDAYLQLRQSGLEGGGRMSEDEYNYYSAWCSAHSDVEYYDILNPEQEDLTC